MKRTHYCGQLNKSNLGQNVTLFGWVKSIRDHKKILFIDMYDREGSLQILFKDSALDNLRNEINKLTPESCISIKGKVIERDTDKKNSKLPTGEIEIEASELSIISISPSLPFDPDNSKTSEEIRLKYRYLDLRNPAAKYAFKIRSLFAHSMRETLIKDGFFEIETPYMIKYTPGGARNFLVPSRNYPGKAYALAESPQIFKQLFMISGFDKYFQFARCFRDEDLRAERQPEFTQLDLEMSFIDEENIFSIIENCIKESCQKVLGKTINTPFSRIEFEEVMSKYGSDKPDLRYDFILQDITPLFNLVEADFIKKGVASGQAVIAIAFPNTPQLNRKSFDAITSKAINCGSKGLINLYYKDSTFVGAIAKFLSENFKSKVVSELNLKDNTNIFAIMAEKSKCLEIMGRLRAEFIDLFAIQPSTEYAFCWVTGFPLFAKSDDGEIIANHHLFTHPRIEDLKYMDTDPLKIRARQYDLVLNGVEIAGGSIRVHNPELQTKIFKTVRIGDEEARDRFGFFLEALKYGAPPHGGIAVGFDRLIMELLHQKSLRDIIALPKTQNGQCLLTEAPSQITEKQLRELHIKITE
ncbi:MAG: aspartate--tRNA ligase [Planctomycetes bacterium]|nr:aspartate--tRNA ligase [Planctomycetota bacterium]